MADKNINLSVIFSLRDKLSGPFNKIGRDFANLQSKMTAAGKRMTSIGKTMSTRLTLPLALIGGNAVGTAVQFDDSMRKVQAVTGATADQFSQLREEARRLGKGTRFTASEAAEGMKFLSMAGLSVQEVMKAIPKSLQLAAAGAIGLGDAADISTNIMTAMGLQVEELTRVNDVMALTTTSTNTNMLELGEAMRNVAGFASEVGIDLETLSGALGKMASSGDKGGIAGTLLRNALRELVTPSEQMIEAFGKLGVNLDEFVTKSGQIKDLPGLLDKLKSKGAQANTIFENLGERGGRAFLSLMKETGPNLRNLISDLREAEGTSARMADTMEKGIGGALRKFRSELSNVNIELGDILAPILIDIAKKISVVFNWFTGLGDTTKKMIVIVGLLVAALGPLIIIIGQMAIAMGALNLSMLPMLGTVLAIAAAVGALIYVLKKLRGARAGVGTGVQPRIREREPAGPMISEEEFNRFAEGGQTDININLTSDEGTSATIEGIRKRGRSGRLTLATDTGQTVKR